MSYKLFYFPGRGRAETARWLFAEAGQAYEDVRVTDWPALKPEMPFGQMPALQYDGVYYAQSHAIERFLARRFNLYGNGDVDALKVDMIVDEVSDIINKMAVLYSTPEDKKAEVIAKLETEFVAPHFGYLSKILGDKTFFLGDQFSLADVAVAQLLEGLSKMMPTAFEGAPALKGLYERVIARPNIASWIANRPASPW